MADAEQQDRYEPLETTEEVETETVETEAVVSEAQTGETETLNEVEESTETEAKPADSSPEKEESKGVQKRLDEITRARREAERERDYYRKLAEESQKVEPIKPTETPVDKTLEDFGYDEGKYQSYLMQTVETRAVEAAKAELERARTQETTLKRQVAHSEKEDAYAKEADDYYQITRSENFPFTESMAQLTMEMEHGPEVTHYLAKNHDISEKIARLPDMQAAIEMGRLEERLVTQRKQKGPSVTNAPEPAPKLKATNASVNVSPSSGDSDSLSTEEWLAKRNKQIEKQYG